MSEGKKKLIFLISDGVSDRAQAQKQFRALTILQAKKTPFEPVDGMNPEQKERWAIYSLIIASFCVTLL